MVSFVAKGDFSTQETSFRLVEFKVNPLKSFTMQSFQMPSNGHIPGLPPRPRMDINLFEIINDSVHHCAMSVTRLWDGWTDAVDDVYRAMVDLAKYLEVSDDMYMEFIGLLSRHPPRPETPSKAELEFARSESIMETERAAIFEFWLYWEHYANTLEDTHSIMARQLARCAFKPEVTEIMDMDLGFLDMSRLSLSANPSTEGYLQSILRSTLGGPGRPMHSMSSTSFDEWTRTRTRGSMSNVHIDVQPGHERHRSDSPLSFSKENEEFENGGREALQKTVRQLSSELEDESVDHGYPEDPNRPDASVDGLNFERLHMRDDQEMEDDEIL